MYDLDCFIIAVYCLTCKYYPLLFPQGIRQRGFDPKLSDEEALTIGIVGEYLGLGNDKAIYEYFCRHYKGWFPNLGDRTTLVRQWANLWIVQQHIWIAILLESGALEDPHQFIDTIPLPLIGLKRAPRRQIFKGDLLLELDYGYCESKDMHYFGLKGALRITLIGFITQAVPVSPRPHDSQYLDLLLAELLPGSIVGGDKAFIDRSEKEQLKQTKDIVLLTPKKKNMSPSSFDMGTLEIRLRRLIETVGSQLTERFNVQRMKARKGWTLLAKWFRKILAHTVCVWLNILNGRDPLDLDGLVTA